MAERITVAGLEEALLEVAGGKVPSRELEVGDWNPILLWNMITGIINKPQFEGMEAVNERHDNGNFIVITRKKQI